MVIGKFEIDLKTHREGLTKNTIDMYTFKKDFETDLSLHRNTLLFSLNEIREKTFTMVNDLDSKCNSFVLNADKLCLRLEIIGESQKDFKDTNGRVIVLENNFSRYQKNVAAIVDILDKNKLIKK